MLFGTLVNHFQIFRQPIRSSDHVRTMILASLVLHNYLQEARHNVPPDLVDRDVNNGMIIAISWQHVGTEVD